jgi:hypothetical protein
MTVLLRDGRIYEKVFYAEERQFEDVAKGQLSNALPAFWVLPFKPLVVGEEGERGRPDLAIIDKNYRSWLVVEVELSRHSLSHHVRPQIETLVRSAYHAAHADLILAAAPHIDATRLRDLLTSVPPDFMVVVDCQSVLQKGWTDLERELHAYLTFLEVYRAANNDSVFVMSGYLPEVRPSRLAALHKHRMMNALVCKDTSSLPAAALGGFCAYSGERPLQWRVAQTPSFAVLLPPGGVTIRPDRRYELLRADDGRFRIEID